MSKETQNIELSDNKALNIADVMRSFLKENMTIELTIGNETDHYTEYKTVEIRVLLGNDEICSSSDSFS